MSRTVYLVGSVPMASAEHVFRNVAAKLGPHLRWLPDGETGKRLDWITWLEPIFSGNPALMPSGKTFQVHASAEAHTRYTLRPGSQVEDVVLDNLLYADMAAQSFATFSRLKRDGAMSSCRSISFRPTRCCGCSSRTSCSRRWTRSTTRR